MDKTHDSKQAASKPPVPVGRRNRRFFKEVLSEDAKEVTMRVQHQAYKGQSISDTVRTDRKFDPKQRFTSLNGRSL